MEQDGVKWTDLPPPPRSPSPSPSALPQGANVVIARPEPCSARSLVSKSAMPMRIPTGSFASGQVVVFATNSYADQAVLSSSVHQLWAANYGGTVGTRVLYAPSDVFETFPRPDETERLNRVGRTLDVERREVMLRRSLGVTDLYNLINNPEITGADPDVARMRAIHVELDSTVADTYGWSDIPLEHGFHTYKQVQRWTVILLRGLRFWIGCSRRITAAQLEKQWRRPRRVRARGTSQRRWTRRGCSEERHSRQAKGPWRG
jgi:hypothetical protein